VIAMLKEHSPHCPESNAFPLLSSIDEVIPVVQDDIVHALALSQEKLLHLFLDRQGASSV